MATRLHDRFIPLGLAGFTRKAQTINLSRLRISLVSVKPATAHPVAAAACRILDTAKAARLRAAAREAGAAACGGSAVAYA